MKIKTLVFGLTLSLLFLSCNKEDESLFSADDAKINANIDMISDDVSKIIDDQYDSQAAASGRASSAFQSILPSCATITITVTESVWTRTVEFGTVGCAMPNGNVLKGKIIVSGSTDFNQSSYTYTYSFENFYHNDKLIGGNKIAVRTLQSTAALSELHPVVNVQLDLTITYPNGAVYTRIGNRVRELIEGYNTPLVWLDNVYSITGSWATTFPNGIHTATITTPLIVKLSCPHIVSGVVSIVRDNATSSIDFGDGSCDNLAIFTFNGNDYSIVLGN